MEDPSIYAYMDCFDASALVKKYIQEDGSDILRRYIYRRPGGYTTPFCYFETLSVLKAKWLYDKKGKRISKAEYLKAAFDLTAWFASVSRDMKDVVFTDIFVYKNVQDISERYSIDLSDAFQIISVKKGYYSPLVRKSATLLVTADKKLAEVARSEGIRAWYFMDEPEP
jgi:predicted nucleic acid-binding protein